MAYKSFVFSRTNFKTTCIYYNDDGRCYYKKIIKRINGKLYNLLYEQIGDKYRIHITYYTNSSNKILSLAFVDEFQNYIAGIFPAKIYFDENMQITHQYYFNGYGNVTKEERFN